MVIPARWSLYQNETVHNILWKLGPDFSALKSLQILSFLYLPDFKSNHNVYNLPAQISNIVPLLNRSHMKDNGDKYYTIKVFVYL
jgi:hypothetical protein